MKSRRAPAILNWAGSKARVAKVLCGLDLPRFETYHEPFLGSGAAFLGLASAALISESLLSDIECAMVALSDIPADRVPRYARGGNSRPPDSGHFSTCRKIRFPFRVDAPHGQALLVAIGRTPGGNCTRNIQSEKAT